MSPATTFVYSESGRGEAGRSLFFVLRHATQAERLARELISVFKAGTVWETARAFAWEVRMRVERTEAETGEPVHLSLILVEPPEAHGLARGDGLLAYDDGAGLAFSVRLARGVPRLLARPQRDGWFVRTGRPYVGEHFVLGFRGELSDVDAKELASLSRLLERASRPNPIADVARAISDRGGALVVGRFNHLPWNDAKPRPEAIRKRLSIPGFRERFLAVLLLGTALVAFVRLHEAGRRAAGTSAVASTAGPAADDRSAWHCRLPSPVRQAPLPVGDDLFVPCEDGSLRVVDAMSGAVIRSLPPGGAASCGPILAEGLLVVGDLGGDLVACDPVSGRVAWRQALGQPVKGLVSDRDRIWAAAGEDLISIEAETGELRWRRALGSAPIEAVQIASGVGVAVAGDGELIAFNPWSGRARWRLNLGGLPSGAPQVQKGRLYAATQDGTVSAFSLNRGIRLWERSLGYRVAEGVAIDGERVYAISEGGVLVAMEISTGELLWRRSTGRPSLCAPVVDGERLLCLATDGILGVYACLNGRSIESRRFVSAAASAPLIHGHRLITVTASGDLEALARGVSEGA